MEVNLTKYQLKMMERLDRAERSVKIFRDFISLGFTSQDAIFAMLCIHHAQHNTPESRKLFASLWNFRQYDEDLISDLESVLQSINQISNKNAKSNK